MPMRILQRPPSGRDQSRAHPELAEVLAGG